MASTGNNAFAYHEPGIVTIMILTSFLLLLNITNYALDRLVYSGLLGQILIGVWFGTPGTHWLSDSIELAAQQLGYMGLILLVYEGGLQTNIKTLKANLLLSSAVAITGIALPIGLSFVLQRLLSITPVEAFAAGAALCSTSLGTTFTVLKTSGLTESRLGVVLTSAAMMDDVVGLVMVQIISSLGEAASSFSATTVIRPVFVSIAFAVVVPAACKLLVLPVTKWCYAQGLPSAKPAGLAYLATRQARFVAHTLFLIAMVAGSTYAGTSNLFAAYLTGAVVTWHDSVIDGLGSAKLPHTAAKTNVSPQMQGQASEPLATPADADGRSGYGPSMPADGTGSQQVLELRNESAGTSIYNTYYHTPLETILKPLFFASIGLSIPITQMFSAAVVWRGILYALLMTFAKLVCGMWLLRLPGFAIPQRVRKSLSKVSVAHWYLWCKPTQRQHKPDTTVTGAADPVPPAAAVQGNAQPAPATQARPQSSISAKPLSLYPAAILGSAMVARGEIGFLISSVAQSTGVFANKEVFLVVTWAIFLCTLFGPVTVGLLVRRVKTLQDTERAQKSGRQDPLGIWGITSSS
ncbi:hypothetical protein LTR15_009002 [Elasticomyces elasticus]|nr:hypothetical protein LTR15_009002 [Elasticomyces elasticus]